MTLRWASMATSIDDLKSALFWRAMAAEFVGTLFLTFVGTGSCIGWDVDYEPTVVQIALCFGLIVGTMVWCIGHVSGGHINPAVTVAQLITRRISVARAIFFVIAQVVGAIVGSALLLAVTPAEFRGSLGATVPNAAMNQGQAFGVEMLITFVLVFTVFASTDDTRSDLAGSVPLTVGLSVTVCHLFAIKYTGSSMNPARSIGPAVVANVWREHWVYWCGPLLGGVAAALVYDSIFSANASLSKARGYLLAANYNPGTYEANQEQPATVLTEVNGNDTKDDSV